MENTINLLGKQTKDTTTNEYQKHFLQYACTATANTKIADGTKKCPTICRAKCLVCKW